MIHRPAFPSSRRAARRRQARELSVRRKDGVDYAQGYHVAMPRAFASGDLARAATVEAA